MKLSLDYPGLVKPIPGWTDVNIRDYFENKVREFGEQTFLIFEDRNLSFKEVDRIVNRLANGLKGLGLEKGDVVGVCLLSCLEYVFSFLAISKFGGILLPVNVDLKRDELTGILRHSRVRAIITNEKLVQNVLNVRDDLESLKQIILIGGHKIEGNVDFDELMEQSEELEPIAIGIDDPATIIYTFASKNLLRGVLTSHRFATRYGMLSDYSFRLTPRDRIMVVIPLYHGVALFHAIMGSMELGIPCIIIEHFSATRFWDQARRYGATMVYAVGAILGMLYNQPEKADDQEHPVRMIWGFMISADIHLAFEKRFRCTVIEGLGQTETGRICANFPPIRKIGSVGLPFDRFTDLSIRDESNNEVAAGEVGEICVRTPLLMNCLLHDAEETDRAFLGGWYHTHDFGRMDRDGFVYYQGRKIDAIRRRGKMIICSDVEEVMRSYPHLRDVMVAPLQSEVGEEDILAMMVARDGSDPVDPLDVARFCKERLAFYKVPRYYMFCDALPKDRLSMIEMIREVDVEKFVEIPVTKDGEEIRRPKNNGAKVRRGV